MQAHNLYRQQQHIWADNPSLQSMVGCANFLARPAYWLKTWLGCGERYSEGYAPLLPKQIEAAAYLNR
jgi:hypothetical protein